MILWDDGTPSLKSLLQDDDIVWVVRNEDLTEARIYLRLECVTDNRNQVKLNEMSGCLRDTIDMCTGVGLGDPIGRPYPNAAYLCLVISTRIPSVLTWAPSRCLVSFTLLRDSTRVGRNPKFRVLNCLHAYMLACLYACMLMCNRAHLIHSLVLTDY